MGPSPSGRLTFDIPDVVVTVVETAALVLLALAAFASATAAAFFPSAAVVRTVVAVARYYSAQRTGAQVALADWNSTPATIRYARRRVV